MLGNLPYPPLSPGVHLFKNCDVDFEPSYLIKVDDN